MIIYKYTKNVCFRNLPGHRHDISERVERCKGSDTPMQEKRHGAEHRQQDANHKTDDESLDAGRPAERRRLVDLRIVLEAIGVRGRDAIG